jgi:hypothetical protein
MRAPRVLYALDPGRAGNLVAVQATLPNAQAKPVVIIEEFAP